MGQVGRADLQTAQQKEELVMLTINVYLKGGITKIDGYQDKVYKDGSGHRINDVKIISDSTGRWYFSPNSLDAPIPEYLAEYVSEITCHTWLGLNTARRESGAYKHKSAMAELEYHDSSGRGSHRAKLEMRADNMADIAELLALIKSGAIRPDISYEGSQGGLSRSELLHRMEELEGELKHQKWIATSLRKEMDLISPYLSWGYAKRIKRAVDALREDILSGFGAFGFLTRREPIVNRLLDILEIKPNPDDPCLKDDVKEPADSEVAPEKSELETTDSTGDMSLADIAPDLPDPLLDVEDDIQ